MNWTILGFALVAFLSTLIGGTVAVRFRKSLPYFFAFASGTLLAVTFFDILPESLKISESASLDVRYVMIVLVAAFFFYSFLERYFLTHHHHAHKPDEHKHMMGKVGAGGLVLHSFLDGVAMGAAFHVSSSLGLIVALAVIFHDFTDGINTVTLMLKDGHLVKHAVLFLIMDAVAPVAGVLLTSMIIINPAILALILAAFSGEFLYISATNLLPETYKHTTWKMLLLMGAGIVLILLITSII